MANQNKVVFLDADEFYQKLEFILDEKIKINHTNNHLSNNEPEKLLKRKDIIKIFDISYPTLDKWMKAGQIPFNKIGRKVTFKKSDVDKIIDGGLK